VQQYRLKLNLQQFAGEKTERATSKKRQDSRNKGQVAKSTEIPSTVILLACISIFLMLGPFFQKQILAMFGDIILHRLSMDVTEENVLTLFGHYAIQMLLFLAPIFVIVLLIAFAANYVQIGWLFTLKPLEPKLSKLNPLTGAKNIFGIRSVVEFFKSSLKLMSVAIIVYSIISSEMKRFLDLAHLPLEDTFAFVSSLTIRMGLFVAVLLFILAIGDLIYKRYEHEKSLKMSKQDIKDEYKNMEGDPLIKGKIKERQRKMALMRMMQEVPKADVVITNPTHFAVALKYDGEKMEAPTVIAKGQDYIALRIRELAKQNDVITMENKPLARALYEKTEVGDSVPADLFQAVAEVLAYVYRLKGRR
jgi:flagellar biosynthetic protein FlhB